MKRKRKLPPPPDVMSKIRALSGAIQSLSVLPSEGDFVMFAKPFIVALDQCYERLHYKYCGYLQDPVWRARNKKAVKKARRRKVAG